MVNGGVVVQDGTFFGSNAISKEYIVIGENSIIGGGTSVMRSLEKNAFIKA